MCFKIWVEKTGDRADLRGQWSEHMIDRGRRHGLNVARPQRLGFGQAMTVATLDSDCRKTDGHGRIDLEATIRGLVLAESVLSEGANGDPVPAVEEA